jgi:Raf kinase inhibitor-like YbhB/YbcL family protein
VWRGVPDGTASLALLVEDADAPSLSPFVHALVWALPAQESGLAEGAIKPDGNAGPGGDVGRNSTFNEGWLPPDPPPGHGSHDYVFQLFALSDTPKLGDNPGRSLFAKAIQGRVLAAGILVGTYSRDEPARNGPQAAAIASPGAL